MEVHPPDHPIHTPRQFFLHLFTITIGLLIALGLEAVVESIHHHHQVRETREALDREREQNILHFAEDTKHFREESALLKNNLVVLHYLHDHPGTREEDLPGVLGWGNSWQGFSTVAWETAQSTQVTALMPQDEVTRDSDMYDYLEGLGKDNAECWTDAVNVGKYGIFDHNLTHLDAAGLAEELELTKTLTAAHYRRGVDMENMSAVFPEFKPAPSMDELRELMGGLTPAEKQALAKPIALSKARIYGAPN